MLTPKLKGDIKHKIKYVTIRRRHHYNQDNPQDDNEEDVKYYHWRFAFQFLNREVDI